MSNIRRNILLVGTVVCILVTSGTAVAITETDNTDDVWHYQETDSGWSWEKYTGDKPNLDITEVSQSFDGSKVTLTLKVDGEIENSKDITYILYLEGDNSDYGAYYTNNEGYVGGKGEASGFYNMLDNPVSGNTFSATFEVDNPDESYNVYGYTQEYIGSEEHWGDYAPNEYAPWYSEDDDTTDDDTTDGGEDNTPDNATDGDSADNATDDGETDDTSNGEDSSGNGTPGFELVLVFLAAILISVFLMKRRKL
ncbi:MAG: Heimdall-CTERM domain-containing surface protein [Candidatus Thermoplasmatota archaeon]